MKAEEITKLANDWSDNFDSDDPTCAKLKRMTAELSYKKGAEMVNSKQPYTAEDMKSFAIWVDNRCRFPFPFSNEELVWHNYEPKTLDEVLKLWEENK